MFSVETYRFATPDDAEILLSIYRPYVESSPVTFEWTVPTAEEFRARVEKISAQYPYLVAERDGEIIGYAYAGPYRSREGFRWTAELSVYVKKGLQGQGVGTHLYARLLDLLRLQGYLNVCAVVSWPNPGSAKLHEHFAFRCGGIQKKCGFKDGHWCDVAIFERPLADYPVPPAEPIPITRLPDDAVARIMNF